MVSGAGQREIASLVAEPDCRKASRADTKSDRAKASKGRSETRGCRATSMRMWRETHIAGNWHVAAVVQWQMQRPTSNA